MREVTYSRDAEKTLLRMPVNTSSLIRRKISEYAGDPKSLASNVKVLKGNPGYSRLRVGDWRIIFREDAVVVAIVKVAPRGDVYD